AEGGVTEAGQQRLEALVILRLTGGAEGPERAAVETVHHRDDLVAPRLAVQPRQLDGRLVRLGAAVTEETLAFQAAALDQLPGELTLGLGVPRVGDVDQPPDLVADRLHHARRAVANQVAAPAGEEVVVAVALGVPDVRPLAAHQGDRVARVVADDVLAKKVDHLGRSRRRWHGSYFAVSSVE